MKAIKKRYQFYFFILCLGWLPILLQGQAENTLNGFIYYPIQSTSNLALCPSEAEGIGVKGIVVDLIDVSDGTTVVATSTTDSNGQFAFPKPEKGLLIIRPRVPEVNFLSGISTYDILLITKQVLGIENFKCPLKKIAADVNHSKSITTFDIVDLRKHILNITTIATPNIEEQANVYHDTDGVLPHCHVNWLLVSNAYTTASLHHPDQQFLVDYWGNSETSLLEDKIQIRDEVQVFEYPFLYATDANTQCVVNNEYEDASWLNRLYEWDYEGTDGTCDKVNYGFWLIKPGDINANAVIPDFSNTVGNTRITPVNPFDYVINHTIPEGIEGSRISEQLSFKVRVSSKKDLEGFQIGVQLDTSLFEIKEIIPIDNGLITQTVVDHYNTVDQEIANGHIRGMWYNENFEDYPSGIPIKDGIDILHLDIVYKGDNLTQEEFLEAAFLEATLLQTEFISGPNLLSEKEIDIDFQVTFKE